jgi:hypothetical protein
MLARTSTPNAPWNVVSFEDKRYGRIAALDHVVERLSAGMDLSAPPLAPEVVPEVARLEAEAAADRGESSRGQAEKNGRKKNAARKRRASK